MDPSKSGFGANQEGSKINQLPINYEMLHKKMQIGDSSVLRGVYYLYIN